MPLVEIEKQKYARLTDKQLSFLGIPSIKNEIILCNISGARNHHNFFYFNAWKHVSRSELQNCSFCTKTQFNKLKEELNSFYTIKTAYSLSSLFSTPNDIDKYSGESYEQYANRVYVVLDNLLQYNFGFTIKLYNNVDQIDKFDLFRLNGTIKVINKEKFSTFLLEHSDIILKMEKMKIVNYYES